MNNESYHPGRGLVQFSLGLRPLASARSLLPVALARPPGEHAPLKEGIMICRGVGWVDPNLLRHRVIVPLNLGAGRRVAVCGIRISRRRA